MMINPGSNDSASVFALLTAIASPEAAKAALQEIVDASTAYQRIIETNRQEMQQANSDLAIRKSEVDVNLNTAIQIRDDFNKTQDAKRKELNNLALSLDNRQSAIDAVEADQSSRGAQLTSREQLVSAREVAVSSLEIAANQLNATAQAMKDDYENKLVALKAITNPTKEI